MKTIEVTDAQYVELGSRTTGFGQKPQDVIEELLRQSPKPEAKEAVVDTEVSEGSYLTPAEHTKLKALIRRLVKASIALNQQGSADPEDRPFIKEEHNIAYNRLHGFLRSIKG